MVRLKNLKCECAAGQGPNGHCKHIQAVVYACCVFNKSGKIHVELACTEKLWSFHKIKRHMGSPLKVKDLNKPGCDEVSNIQDFEPRPERYRNSSSYQAYFQNTCLNFKGISKTPIFQLFLPANALAVAHDNDYLLKTPEDISFRSFWCFFY